MLNFLTVNSGRLLRVLQGACLLLALCALWLVTADTAATVQAQEPAVPPAVDVPMAVATTEKEMKPYTEIMTGTDVKFDMLPIPGGKYAMGTPEGEADREDDEGPIHEVEIAPFWMGKCEVTWEEYEQWCYSLEVKRRDVEKLTATPRDKLADAVTRPTKPYTDMSFGMGREGFPAISMTGLAAKTYCEWLSVKTGRFYRLPTEAEWEYACRAGTKTVYSFGDDPAALGEHAWFIDNSNDKYQLVGKKKPNPWGLHDIHGNVMEWCLDQYSADQYSKSAPANPFVLQTKEYPQVARGGAWDSDPAMCRSGARESSNSEWKIKDPNIPKSKWYLTDAQFVGFRLVRPLDPVADQERVKSKPPAK